MNHIASHHIVALSRIDKIVGLGAGVFGSTKEHQGMLQHAGRIVVAYDDLQTTFQILGAGHKIGSGIAFGVGLRSFHIAFAIHHFVVFPV